MDGRLVSRFALCAVLASTAACEEQPADLPRTGQHYLRWQAPAQMAVGSGEANIQWVDDDNVLFLGYSDAEASPASRSLRLWTLSTNQVKTLGPSFGDLCYFQGYLRYHEWRDSTGETLIIREGSVVETNAKHVHGTEYFRDLSRRGMRWHLFNCQPYDPRELAPEENCKIPLLHGDGVLDTRGGACAPEVRRKIEEARRIDRDEDRRPDAELGVQAELASRPAVFYPHGRSDPITLPIEAGELHIFGSNFSYIEWAQRYVLPQYDGKGRPSRLTGRSVWPTEHYSIYLLAKTGAVERIDLPLRKYFLYRPPRVIPTRAGVVAGSPGAAAVGKRRILGIVLFGDRGAEWLDDGWTTQMALSPNGCRIAYERRDEIALRQRSSDVLLRVIDLCTRTQ